MAYVVANEFKNALPEICWKMKIHAEIFRIISRVQSQTGPTDHGTSEVCSPETEVAAGQHVGTTRDTTAFQTYRSSQEPLSAVLDSSIACSIASTSRRACPASTSTLARRRFKTRRALSR